MTNHFFMKFSLFSISLAVLSTLAFSASPSFAGTGVIHNTLISESGKTKGSFRGLACNERLTELMAIPTGYDADTIAAVFSQEMFQYRFEISAAGRQYMRTMCLVGNDLVGDGSIDFVGLFAEDNTDQKKRESCIGMVFIEELGNVNYNKTLVYMSGTEFADCPFSNEVITMQLKGDFGINRVGNSTFPTLMLGKTK